MELSFGQRAADALSDFVGSWKFVIGQAVFLTAWFVLNLVSWFWHWDPYPFILANLFMSAEAAFTGPIIMMSQNRAAHRDRMVLNADYREDQETNRLVEMIADHIGVDRSAK